MKINILGVQVDSVTQEQALEKVNDFLNSNSQHHISASATCSSSSKIPVSR